MPYADIAPFYEGFPIRERLHVRIRYASAPLDQVASLIPAEVKSVVELGCSNGVFANVLKSRRPELDVVGVDVDAAKIEVARKTVRGRKGLRFVVDEASAYGEKHGPWEAVAVVDMLYLWPAARQDELIRLLSRRLRPGGYLILKEMTDRPRWKRRWCRFQERLAVGVFRITEGEGVHLRSGGEYREAMTGAGLAVETFDLSRRYPHPHFALRGRKDR